MFANAIGPDRMLKTPGKTGRNTGSELCFPSCMSGVRVPSPALCTANHRSLVTVREFFYAVAQGCSHAPAANVPFTADLQRTGDDTLFGKTQSPQRITENRRGVSCNRLCDAGERSSVSSKSYDFYPSALLRASSAISAFSWATPSAPKRFRLRRYAPSEGRLLRPTAALRVTG